MSTLAQPLPLDRDGAPPPPVGSEDLEWVVEMAHDLRSPLSSILVLAESLRDGRSGGVNDVQKRQLGLIYSAALYLCAEASDLTELMRGSDRLADRSAASPLAVAPRSRLTPGGTLTSCRRRSSPTSCQPGTTATRTSARPDGGTDAKSRS